MNTNKLVTGLVTFLGTIVVLVGIGWLGWQFIAPRLGVLNNQRENPNIVPFHVHFNVDPERLWIVQDGRRITEGTPPLYHNGRVYLPLDFVRGYIDPFMHWDAGAQLLFVSTRYEMWSFRHGDIRVAEGVPFIPADMIMDMYYFSVDFQPAYNMIVVLDTRRAQTMAQAANNTPVRYFPDIAAPMTARLGSYARVFIISEQGAWTRVRMGNGLLGYVLTQALGIPQELTTTLEPPQRLDARLDNFNPRQPNWDGGPINMVWDTSPNTNTPLPEHLTAISPTWFRFDVETRGIVSTANAAFVEWAQEQGVQVWPNVTDVYADPGIGDILQDMTARRRIIDQLAYYVATLNLDGLSINIEALWFHRYGSYYVQFMRELNLALGHDIIIVAAMKVDPFINPHYRHDLIAKTVDFVALMTYDEHYGGSPEPGPTASLPWVERQLTMILRMVNPDQLLMGLPFYNRVWRTAIGDNTRRPMLNWNMDWTAEVIYNRNLTPEWNEAWGLYYTEFVAVVNGETLRHQLWMECPRSIGQKMQLFNYFNLAGVAGWSLGFTNDAVWDVLAHYFPVR